MDRLSTLVRLLSAGTNRAQHADAPRQHRPQSWQRPCSAPCALTKHFVEVGGHPVEVNEVTPVVDCGREAAAGGRGARPGPSGRANTGGVCGAARQRAQLRYNQAHASTGARFSPKFATMMAQVAGLLSSAATPTLLAAAAPPAAAPPAAAAAPLGCPGTTAAHISRSGTPARPNM